MALDCDHDDFWILESLIDTEREAVNDSAPCDAVQSRRFEVAHGSNLLKGILLPRVLGQGRVRQGPIPGVSINRAKVRGKRLKAAPLVRERVAEERSAARRV
ncbi:MAG: hypothetical protein ACREU8_09045, partial [Gammaproteobacteria bacterium]